VASNLLVYYEEGDPSKVVVPDDFVVKDSDPNRRRTFKIWEEGKAPDVVFEVTSRGTRQEDRQWKPQKYARIGVDGLGKPSYVPLSCSARVFAPDGSL